MHHFSVEKVGNQQFGLHTSAIKKLSKISIRHIGEDSTTLVTLIVIHIVAHTIQLPGRTVAIEKV
jgi:hypothetical protein